MLDFELFGLSCDVQIWGTDEHLFIMFLDGPELFLETYGED